MNYDNLVSSIAETIDFMCFDRPTQADLIPGWLCARAATRDARQLLRERYGNTHIVSLLSYHLLSN